MAGSTANRAYLRSLCAAEVASWEMSGCLYCGQVLPPGTVLTSLGADDLVMQSYASRMAREAPGQTSQATALVHEHPES